MLVTQMLDKLMEKSSGGIGAVDGQQEVAERDLSVLLVDEAVHEATVSRMSSRQGSRRRRIGFDIETLQPPTRKELIPNSIDLGELNAQFKIVDLNNNT